MTKKIWPSIRVKSLTYIYQVILSNERTLDISLLEPALLRHALELGFGPLLYFYGMFNNASASSQSLIQAADLSAKVLTGNQLDALEDIISAAGDITRDIILLKGMSVALQYYPEPYMRIMGDIDLLVQGSRQVELENICLELGYVRKSNLAEEFYIDHHHGMPLYKSSNNVWVEIHTSLFPKNLPVHSDHIFKLQNVLNQITPLSAKPVLANKLSVELELLYICAHWALELNWQKSGVRLLDILYILNEAKLDWDQIFLWLAESPATAKPFYVLLTLINEEQLFNVPSDKLNDLANFAPSLNSINRRLLTHFTRKYLFLGEKFGPILTENNVSIIWRELMFGRCHPIIALFAIIPYKMLFPSTAEKRFSIIFQLSRIQNVLSKLR